jgi:glycerol uptake facilitator-like aquaporin
MAESLSGGNVAIALLGNTIATGAILVVLITVFGPVSGAHFNPAVTLAFWLDKTVTKRLACLYVIAQIIGAYIGVLAAHAMFAEPLIQASTTPREGLPQYFSEMIATFGLVFIILACVRVKPSAVAMSVGLYITAAYWFTASTSFANPAVTIARAFSDTFAGIRPIDAPAFIIAQFIASIIAWYAYKKIYGEDA